MAVAAVESHGWWTPVLDLSCGQCRETQTLELELEPWLVVVPLDVQSGPVIFKVYACVPRIVQRWP